MTTLAELKDRFNYDPATGIFTWRNPISKKCRAGEVVGSINKNGYLRLTFNGKRFPLHRMAWLYVYGSIPNGMVDHINGIKTDNRISNLRIANKSQNAQNMRKARADNKCGYLGVFRNQNSAKNPWYAQIQIDGKSRHIGCYPTPEAAHLAYIAKKRELHPFGRL